MDVTGNLFVQVPCTIGLALLMLGLAVWLVVFLRRYVWDDRTIDRFILLSFSAFLVVMFGVLECLLAAVLVACWVPGATGGN